MSSRSFEADLRAVLVSRDPLQMPESLLTAVAQLPTSDTGGFRDWVRRVARSESDWFDRFASIAASAVVAVILVVVGSIVFLATTPSPGSITPGTATRAFVWRTQLVALEADALVIEVAGREFRPTPAAAVTSDPGTATYRTLELVWFEQGIEMRLNMYFEADDTAWWVREMRTYDGHVPGEWIHYPGPFFRTFIGDQFEGDVSVAGTGPRGAGQLRIESMRLTAFALGTARPAFGDCRPAGPVVGPGVGVPIPVPGNSDLTFAGISHGMDAKLAETRLSGQGICYEFRFEYPASNLGQVWCTAPPGKVRDFLFGSDGQLIVFVEAGRLETMPPSAPLVVGC